MHFLISTVHFLISDWWEAKVNMPLMRMRDRHLVRYFWQWFYDGLYYSFGRGSVSKRGRQRQRREVRKIFLHNPRISISFIWFPCMFLVSLKFRWLQRLLLNEMMDVSLWNVGTFWRWKWSSWSLIWEQNGTQVSALFHFISRALFVLCN